MQIQRNLKRVENAIEMKSRHKWNKIETQMLQTRVANAKEMKLRRIWNAIEMDRNWNGNTTQRNLEREQATNARNAIARVAASRGGGGGGQGGGGRGG